MPLKLTRVHGVDTQPGSGAYTIPNCGSFTPITTKGNSFRVKRLLDTDSPLILFESGCKKPNAIVAPSSRETIEKQGPTSEWRLRSVERHVFWQTIVREYLI